jgi:hypothetical protein
MKSINLMKNKVLALLTTLLIVSGTSLNAEELGFSLDDSIRKQVFQELKSNVESLYQDRQLLVPSIDTATSSRIAANNSGFIFPVGTNAAQLDKDKKVESIN